MTKKTFFDSMGEDDVWYYNGDTNLEEGGLFYTLGDVVYALEVTPSYDNEREPDEEDCWYVIKNSIFIDEKYVQSALKTLGYEASEDMTSIIDLTGIDARRLVIEAFHAYRGLDDASNPILIKESDLNGKSLAEYVYEEYFTNQNIIGGPRGIPSYDSEHDINTPSGM